MKLAPLAFLLLSACRIVAGTEDLFIEGGGPAGGGNQGGGDTGGAGGGGAGSCGVGQLAVTITIVGPVVVKIDSTGEELSTGESQLCLDAGDQRLRASCTDDSNAAVAWGNDVCANDEDTCDFTLEENEIFVVDGASACASV